MLFTRCRILGNPVSTLPPAGTITAVAAAYRWRWSSVGGSIGALLARLTSRRQQLLHARLYRVFHPRGSHLLVRVRPCVRTSTQKNINEMPEFAVST